MSNKADKYRCQLVIVDENSKRIASLPFDMEVTKAAMDENSEAIEEDASLYQQYTEAVQGAIAEANANINSEASTRASADSNLQSQINQIVAPSGEAPSAAEVQNARIGADNVTYPTLGDAIRGQVTNLKSAFNLNVFGNNYNSEVASVTRGEETAFLELFLVGGYKYTIRIDFGHQIGSAFLFEATSGNDVVASKTIGAQSTTGELSFTAENDTYADFKYLTIDTTTTSFTYTVSVDRGLSDIVENIEDNDLAIQRINQYGGTHTIEKGGLRYAVANKIFEFFATAKAVYKLDITLNQALSRNTLVRIADEGGNYVAVFKINAGWQSQTFYYVNADQGPYTIELYTPDQGISSVSIVITTIGTEAKLSERIDTTRALFGNEKSILSTTGSSTTVNQFITFPCRIRHGYTYLCVVSSTSSHNRFACMKNGSNTWITQMFTNPLSDHEFSFIADDDYTAFALYNTTACDYSIQIYEIEKNILAESLRHNDYAVYHGDTKNTEKPYICNAVSMPNGVIVAARSDGTIVKIDLDGTETQIYDFDMTDTHCRCMFFDTKGNLYVSPSYFGNGNFVNAGLYRMAKGTFTLEKVLSLYNNGSATDSTIWTMTEDNNGNLYAGEYSVRNANPKVYKSTDGGTTWSMIHNFVNDVSEGRHIHWIEYSPWQDALYVIVGEVNTIFKSTDGGSTWTNLNVALSNGKGCGAITTPNGLIIGSDSDSVLTFHLIENDDKTVRLIDTFWHNMCFAMRRNNLNGDIFAFGDIDVSARNEVKYPPYSVLSLEDPMTGVETWHNSLVSQYGTTLGNQYYNKWLAYYNSMKDVYPDDAIVPHHYGIFVSRDGGLTFEVLNRFESESAGGFNSPGQFYNGECMVGVNGGDNAPLIISTGRQKYAEGGCDFDGQIFVRTNEESVNALV
jgi:hypothetical protein